ncbi:MAG: nickel-dependent hydrogenase large subunit, partial [Candidatus Woesearchaeota archaeon]
NRICEVISGRQIHAISPVVGGFSKVPAGLNELKQDLLSCREDAMRTANLFKRLKVAKFSRKAVYASLKTKSFNDYSALSGNVQVGLKSFSPDSYRKHFAEQVVKTSTSKHVTLNGSAVMVGSLARLNNNRQNLSRNAKKALGKMRFPSYNPFHNNLCQAVEIVSFIDRCIDIVSGLQLKDEKPVQIKVRPGRGVSIIEAPRGLLIHECRVNAKGEISDYNIIAPTTINLKNIEEDIKAFLPLLAGKPEKIIVAELEKLIRAYDPCISCSAHFLEVNWRNEKYI